MKLNVIDLQGKKAGTVTVEDAVWGAEAKPTLVAQAVRVYRSNLRQGPAATKNRGEVNRTGRKMWKQKGTGKARHGDRTAPQFVGGAKAHGPTGQENYKLRINQKMKQGALWSVLSDMVRGGRVTVIDSLPEVKKTKELARIVEKIKTNKRTNEQTNKKKNKNEEKILIVIEKPAVETVRAARNLEGVTLARPEELNALTVLRHERMIITKQAVKLIGKLGRLG